jgi:hypothetical protein
LTPVADDQGCQMVSFQTKKPHLGKFLRALHRLENVNFMAMWNILQTFGIFYDHLVHFVFIWHILSGFGIMYQEKSGNPAGDMRRHEATYSVNTPLITIPLRVFVLHM